MPEPKVSICTPVYNQAQYVAETLASLSAQTFGDFEVLVVDDGSTDGSADAVAPFLKDSRFTYVYQDNAGVGAARNRAIDIARGKWLAQVDGDDLLLPDALQVLVTLSKSDNRVNLVYADMAMFGPDGYEQRVFGESQMPQEDVAAWLCRRPRFGTLQNMVRISDVRAIGGYRTHFPALEDYDFWLRMAQHGVWAKSSHEVIARYRVRPNSKTGQVFRNARLMLDMVVEARERETRPELVSALDDCIRFHRSRYELHAARDAMQSGASDVEQHLWRSFRCDWKQKRVFLSALIMAASRLTGTGCGKKTVKRLLDKAFDLPWSVLEEDPKSLSSE